MQSMKLKKVEVGEIRHAVESTQLNEGLAQKLFRTVKIYSD
jgi:hypothetical protein